MGFRQAAAINENERKEYMEDQSRELNVIFELEMGELSAVAMLAHDDVMAGEPGPVVFRTLEDTRVILAFNASVFRARVDRLERHYRRERNGIDCDGARSHVEGLLITSMTDVAHRVAGNYFKSIDVHHLSAPVDDAVVEAIIEGSIWRDAIDLGGGKHGR
jgi:hypothetical protein